MTTKPEVSLGMGLALGALVWLVYDHAMPSLVDHRVGDVDDDHAASAERVATWTAAAAVVTVSALSKDPTVFVIGGLSVIGLSLWHRHANMVDPMTGRAMAKTFTEEADNLGTELAYAGDE